MTAGSAKHATIKPVPKEERSPTQMLIALVTSREQEGTRVARVLHDEVGQVLSAVGLQLDVLRMDMQDRVPEIVGRTAEIQQLLERAITQVRSLSYELNPAIVERAGLQFAMERLCSKYRDQFGGVLRLAFDAAVRVPMPVGSAIFKICELALDNAVTHSGAKQIEVSAKPTSRGATIEVRDNGSGFDAERLPPESSGLGLMLMAHHAMQAGLQFSLKSLPGKGTAVKISYSTSSTTGT
jgi:signal transduction histidine kinase